MITNPCVIFQNQQIFLIQRVEHAWPEDYYLRNLSVYHLKKSLEEITVQDCVLSARCGCEEDLPPKSRHE